MKRILSVIFALPFIISAQNDVKIPLARITTNYCPPSGIICLSANTNTFCFDQGGMVIQLDTENVCNPGLVCTEEGLFPCILAAETTTTTPSTTTSPMTTTTPQPVPAPACNSTGKYPATNCNQYYECIAVWWWFEPVLQTCPNAGEAFNPTNGTCIASTTCTS